MLAAAILFAACNNEKKEEKKDGKETTGTETEVKEWKAVDSATAMKAWMDYATPGEPHKMMAASDGTWEGETTSWMAMELLPASVNQPLSIK